MELHGVDWKLATIESTASKTNEERRICVMMQKMRKMEESISRDVIARFWRDERSI
jgi:hypothetical protein